MNRREYLQPELLLAEIPIKDKTFNDNRKWVYHRLSLSLIEFILVNEFKAFEFTGTQRVFIHEDEEWFGVFVQNNCEATDNDETDVLNRAWQFLKEYLIWEDTEGDNFNLDL